MKIQDLVNSINSNSSLNQVYTVLISNYKGIFEPRLSIKLIEEPLKEIQNKEGTKRGSLIFDKQLIATPTSASNSPKSPIRSKRTSRNSMGREDKGVEANSDELKEIRGLLLQKLNVKNTSEKRLNVSQPNSNQISPQASFELNMNQKKNDLSCANWDSLFIK